MAIGRVEPALVDRSVDFAAHGREAYATRRETSKPIPCPSLRPRARVAGSNPGAAVRSSGLLAPRMLWPLDCFVARAPRNDGWVAADPIASVVIGRRLTPSFCAVSSRSYPATTNSNTVSRRAALAGRCFCARRGGARGWVGRVHALRLWSRLGSGDPRAGSGPIRRPYHRFPFPERDIATNSCTAPHCEFVPACGRSPCEASTVTNLPPQRHGRTLPGDEKYLRPIPVYKRAADGRPKYQPGNHYVTSNRPKS